MTGGGVARIQSTFAGLAGRGEGALIPFLMGGDPTFGESLRLLQAAVEAGADLLEVGIPFSDPLADGPTLQAAADRALAAGVTPGRVLELVAALRRVAPAVPVVLLTYYNVVLQRGLGRFLAEAREAGADGVILPDLPVDEAGEAAAACGAEGLACVLLAAPTSPPQRLARIARSGTGFLYCVSVTGVTGAKDTLSPALSEFLARARRLSPLPLAVGFGISTPAQVARVLEQAEGAIVGSALVERAAAAGPGRAEQAVFDFVRELKAATRPGQAAARRGVGEGGG